MHRLAGGRHLVDPAIIIEIPTGEAGDTFDEDGIRPLALGCRAAQAEVLVSSSLECHGNTACRSDAAIPWLGADALAVRLALTASGRLALGGRGAFVRERVA